MEEKKVKKVKVKREKTALEKKAFDAFKAMKVVDWLAFIDKEAKNKSEREKYLLCAKRSLTLGKMKEYIEENKDTPENRKEFKESTWGIQYQKDEKKKFVKDPFGKKIPVLDENGEPVKKQSIVYAVEYFVNKYFPAFNGEEKKEKVSPFDALKDW